MKNDFPKIRFAVIGMNHGHIYGQVNTLLKAGAELAAFYAVEHDLADQFARAFPQAKPARGEDEILEDESIHLIASAAIPCDRVPLGIRAMRHGKDFMMDKGAPTTLAQLSEIRRVQAETKRILSVYFCERFAEVATVMACDLAKKGRIGKIVQTIGLGPHNIRLPTRPPWFFQRSKYGGIIIDLAAHQFDQFLYLTGATQAKVLFSQVANRNNPQFPELEDFGDVIVSGQDATGYIRVDWLSPDTLKTYGDGRLFILGTEGYIELRKNCDIAGRPGGNHLFVVNREGISHIDCSGGDLPYGRQLLHDVAHRTETAMPQEHCFLACELALMAQDHARRSGNLKEK